MSKFLGFDSVLCLSPHPDDVELSMFGTIAKYQDTKFNILCCSYGTKGDSSSSKNRHYEIMEFWEHSKLKNYWLSFFEGFLTDNSEDETVRLIEEDRYELLYKTQAIFTTSELDSHFEHHIISRIGMALSRRKLLALIQYKSISTLDEWTPNLFVNIDEHYEKKYKLITDNFKSQLDGLPESLLKATHTHMGCVRRGIELVEEYKIKSFYG